MCLRHLRQQRLCGKSIKWMGLVGSHSELTFTYRIQIAQITAPHQGQHLAVVEQVGIIAAGSVHHTLQQGIPRQEDLILHELGDQAGCTHIWCQASHAAISDVAHEYGRCQHVGGLDLRIVLRPK